MFYWIITIAILDLLLGAMVAIPCLFAIASLIGNEPGAEKIINQIMARVFMGLPIACLFAPIIGLILYKFKSNYALLATSFPWIYFSCVVLLMFVMENFFK